MTVDEAIDKLNWALDNNTIEDVQSAYDYITAIKMAIEALEAGHWIPASERLPEEREWIGTKQFVTTISDEVYVTFETPKGDRFTKHLSFQNGKLSVADQQMINAFYKGSVPVAWMPLPEPYKAEREDKE
jgi:hypothetical protein